MKYAWLVVCVSLVASKAFAAIPDSTGVYHGCYNVLSGSLRLIDGTNCNNLLERHVVWQQTGLPGPQGPQGPAGPPGSDAKVVVGFESLNTVSVPREQNASAITFASRKEFTAPADGTCNVAITAFVADDGHPALELFPTYLNDGATWTLLAERAELNGSFGGIQQGSTVAGVRIDAGHTYQFGLTLKSYEDAVTAAGFGKATITWTCVYD